jgi:hypothetical protein
MKTLVLITSAYPFGSGESFVETKFQFLYKAFDRILIIELWHGLYRSE